LDGQVARRDNKIASLLDQFVCVRIIQANGMDLSLFQFDYDLSWAVIFMNADKTIYGRYSSRSHFDALQDVSLNGFQKTLQAVLEIHKGYPANKASLAGKGPVATEYKLPEQYPTLTQFKETVTPGVKRNNTTCMHCHEINKARVEVYRNSKKPVPDDDLWVYPMPDWAGLVLDTEEKSTVKTVEKDSQAEKAGFKPGDEILSMEGQSIISPADVQWVLKHTPEPGTVHAEVKDKSGQTKKIALELPQGWRRVGDLRWRVFARYFRPFMGNDVTPDDRKKDGIKPDAIAIRTDANTPTGIVKGDLVTQIDGKQTGFTLSQVIAYVLQQKMTGEKLAVTLMRNGKEQKLEIPVK
jgi:hypothetical protein